MFYLYYNDGSAEIVEMQCRADDGEGLNHVIVEDSVTSIRKYAFGIDEDEDTSLAGITLPNSVTSIGDGAFWNCRRLTSITLPDSVTSIGNLAFSRCSGMTSITLPDSLTSIGYGAFNGCSKLTSIIWNGETYSSADAFLQAFHSTRVP